ncbi:MAG: hypothetical protein NZ750_07440 [Anaerolineae bacterium]|nr:hypothetical protein [Anaerolineae bacterium]MDW8172181.1 hypothetical protein [Anaerolineae bacterium]
MTDAPSPPSDAPPEPEGLNPRGLIDQYARWKRKAALLIWVALGLLLLGLALQALFAPAG